MFLTRAARCGVRLVFCVINCQLCCLYPSFLPFAVKKKNNSRTRRSKRSTKQQHVILDGYSHVEISAPHVGPHLSNERRERCRFRWKHYVMPEFTWEWWSVRNWRILPNEQALINVVGENSLGLARLTNQQRWCAQPSHPMAVWKYNVYVCDMYLLWARLYWIFIMDNCITAEAVMSLS